MDANASRRTFVTLVGASAAATACGSDTIPSAANPAGPAASAPPPAADTGFGTIPKRPLGKTGASVSIVGLGGYHLGNPDEREALRIMHTAIAAGITFFDNCWDYHGGESERRMGKALRGGKREAVFLMTKIDGRTAEPARLQLEDSLRRLETDVIDLVQIHEVIRDEDPEWVFGPEGAIEALERAKREGKLRYIGFTGHKDPKHHLAMLEKADERGFVFDAVQMPLNVMDPHHASFERQVLPELERRNVGVLGMKPLAAGRIPEAGAVSARECLRYAMSLPTSVVITGCERMRDLEQAISVARGFIPFAPEAMAALRKRTHSLAAGGQLETFKTTREFDGTVQNPHWLSTAEP